MTAALFLNISIAAKDLLLLLTESATDSHYYFSEILHKQMSDMAPVRTLYLDAFIVNIYQIIYKYQNFDVCPLLNNIYTLAKCPHKKKIRY